MKVKETFLSLQGEGANTGMAAIFVRLSGCNLKCGWCDTDHITNAYEIKPKDLADQIKAKYRCKNIIITGGEPLLQADELCIFLDEFKNYFIAVETNGSIAMPTSLNWRIRWMTVSPKEGIELKQVAGTELKVVYTGQDISQYENLFFKHFYLQPCDYHDAERNKKNTEDVIRLIKRNPQWRLSLQTQKILSIQ